MGEPWDETEIRRVMMDRVVRATSDAVGERFVAEPEAVHGHLDSASSGEWDAVCARDLEVISE